MSDDMKPYFVGPDTPLEISDNLRYVFDLKANNDALLRVARAARVLLRHENSPGWKAGLVPWREIVKGPDPDDLVSLAEALEAVKDLL